MAKKLTTMTLAQYRDKYYGSKPTTRALLYRLETLPGVKKYERASPRLILVHVDEASAELTELMAG